MRRETGQAGVQHGMKEPTTRIGGLRAAALLGLGVLLLAVGAGTASAAGSRSYADCAGAVINDWLANEPNVVGHYPIVCYRQAIQQLNSYPDVKDYSNAVDDIQRAEFKELRYQQTHHGAIGPTTTTNPSGPAAGPGGGNNGGGNNGGGKSAITKIFDKLGPGNAQSIPLPLLILAGLAVLLLLAAAGTWIAKRVQSRRLAPAPARPPGPSPRG